MNTAHHFRLAMENKDPIALESLFTYDVLLYSPVRFTPYSGRDAVLAVLPCAWEVFADFQYTGHLSGQAQNTASGEPRHASALLFRARAGLLQMWGTHLIHLNEEGRIEELTYMIRPASALHMVGSLMSEVLAARGIVPPVPKKTTP